MLTFIKNDALTNIKTKLLILYILNVTDIIFTLLLLDTGFYMEVNTFMAKAVQDPFVSLTLKIVLPAVLLIFLYYRMQKATQRQRKKSNLIINLAIACYGLINILHLIWFAILPVFLLS